MLPRIANSLRGSTAETARIRIRQELLLGVGGFRALKAMGITPGVLHLNEGHSGFAVLEAIRNRMEEEGLSFDQAARRVSREVVFTTHTPVPAGHDRFDAALIEEHLGPLRESLGHFARAADGAGPRKSQTIRRDVLHDRAGPEALAPRQCGFGAARRSLARDVDRALSRQRRKTLCPSATSPTACMCPPGWRRRCSAFTTGTWARTGTSTAAKPASGRESKTSTTANCGRRISA